MIGCGSGHEKARAEEQQTRQRATRVGEAEVCPIYQANYSTEELKGKGGRVSTAIKMGSIWLGSG